MNLAVSEGHGWDGHWCMPLTLPGTEGPSPRGCSSSHWSCLCPQETAGIEIRVGAAGWVLVASHRNLYWGTWSQVLPSVGSDTRAGLMLLALGPGTGSRSWKRLTVTT